MISPLIVNAIPDEQHGIKMFQAANVFRSIFLIYQECYCRGKSRFLNWLCLDQQKHEAYGKGSCGHNTNII
jgi:hypothetical protein